jgi:hypothetical protein
MRSERRGKDLSALVCEAMGPRRALVAAVLSAAVFAVVGAPGTTRGRAVKGVAVLSNGSSLSVASVHNFDTDTLQQLVGQKTNPATFIGSTPPSSFAALPDPVEYLEHIVKSMW